jgi:hypothetical protein
MPSFEYLTKKARRLTNSTIPCLQNSTFQKINKKIESSQGSSSKTHAKGRTGILQNDKNPLNNAASNLRYLHESVKNEDVIGTGLIDFWKSFYYGCCRLKFLPCIFAGNFSYE